MHLRFPPLLRAAISSAGWTPAEFSRRVGRSPSYVYGLVNGRHFQPPKDGAALRAWAEVLGLEGKPAEAFVLAALLDRCPEEVRRAFMRLERAGERRTVGRAGAARHGVIG